VEMKNGVNDSFSIGKVEPKAMLAELTVELMYCHNTIVRVIVRLWFSRGFFLIAVCFRFHYSLYSVLNCSSHRLLTMGLASILYMLTFETEASKSAFLIFLN